MTYGERVTASRRRPLLGTPALPVAWLPATVRDGNDEHVIALDRVENAVRKNVGEATADILVEGAPVRRLLQYSVDDLTNAGDKAQIQSRRRE